MGNQVRKHSLLKSTILHLLPGLLIGGCYFALVPVVRKFGFPSVMALMLSGIFVLIPFELGLLIFQKRATGQTFFKGIVLYFNKITTWKYFVLVPAIFIASGLLFKAFSFTSTYLKTLFAWLPSYMFMDMGLDGSYSRSILIKTYIPFFFLIVLILPTIEELYFRGYLLPRMPSRLKGWTEIIHSGLFAAYHTWTPWMFVVRTIGVLPLIYTVKRKENLLIGIIAHCLINSVDLIIGVMFILRF